MLRKGYKDEISAQDSKMRVSGGSIDKDNTLNEAPDPVRRGHKQTENVKIPRNLSGNYCLSAQVKINMVNHLILLPTFCWHYLGRWYWLLLLVSKQDITACIYEVDKRGLKFHWNTPINLLWALGGSNTSAAFPLVPKMSLKILKNQSLIHGSSYLKSFFTPKAFEIFYRQLTVTITFKIPGWEVVYSLQMTLWILLNCYMSSPTIIQYSRKSTKKLHDPEEIQRRVRVLLLKSDILTLQRTFDSSHIQNKSLMALIWADRQDEQTFLDSVLSIIAFFLAKDQPHSCWAKLIECVVPTSELWGKSLGD